MRTVALDRPWLTVDLGHDCRVLGWALNRPGFTTARRIVWREVRDGDLTPALDVRTWLETVLAAAGKADAVAFLTSRDVGAYARADATAGNIAASCVATVGLSNAERVGLRQTRTGGWGTINIAVHVAAGLTDGALVEALSIAAQARTAAVIDAHLPLPGGAATGTGTDCIAVAARPGLTVHAGLHTDIGAAVGAAVYQAVRQGADDWLRRQALGTLGAVCDQATATAIASTNSRNSEK